MLTLQIKEKEIENLTPDEEFIRGTVGAKCQINFDEFWQGYEKYIVFKRVGYEPINIMVDSLENEIEIPYTILADVGEFKIGVFGIKGRETLPTLYSKYINILYGTDTHGTTPPTYIPSEIDQLRLSKQDKLTAGNGIKIENNVISATGGGGSGGTTDYELLENKPKINGIELLGNKSLTDLGIYIPTKTSELDNDSGFIDDTALENYYTKTEVDEKIVGGQSFGHWETVMDIVWNFNDYIHIVSYDPETHIFTCNSGELDWATVGERLTYAIAPVCDTNKCKTTELPFNTFRQLSGDGVGGYTGGFVKLSDTEFTFKDTEGNIIPVPNEATMDIAKFHFEHLVPRTISNLNCTKARYTVTNTISRLSDYCHPPMFFNVATESIRPTYYGYNWIYRSVILGVVELINGYGFEKFDCFQNYTHTSDFTQNAVQQIVKTTKQPLSNPIIKELKFNFNWNDGLSIPRNGGLFKLERWVE